MAHFFYKYEFTPLYGHNYKSSRNTALLGKKLRLCCAETLKIGNNSQKSTCFEQKTTTVCSLRMICHHTP